MWRARVIAAVVVGAVVALAVWPVWRENERRYDALRLTGCFADTTAWLGVAQPCTGNVRRLCRDVPPLVDWRRFCS